MAGVTSIPGMTIAEELLRSEASRLLTPEVKQSILQKVTEGASSLGQGAVKLVNMLRGIRDPEEAIKSFDRQLEANRVRRVPLAERHEKLYAVIVAKKKAYEAAPGARKTMLEMELRNLLAEYKSEERQLRIYLDNELTINTVRGRTLELVALGLQQIKESQIDGLSDKLDDAVAESEDISGALRDLEGAGRRRDRAADHDAFLGELAGFEEMPAAAAAEPGLAGAAPAADPASPEPLDLSSF